MAQCTMQILSVLLTSQHLHSIHGHPLLQRHASSPDPCWHTAGSVALFLRYVLTMSSNMHRTIASSSAKGLHLGDGVRQPVQTLVQALTIGGTSCLDEPLAVAQRVQS